MPDRAFSTFTDVLSSFRRHFTRPSFFHFLVLVVGWILAGDPCRCVTETLVATGASGVLPWTPFHRFFSRASWRIDALGHTLFGLLVPMLRGGVVEFVIDDTLARKKGSHVFGTAMHLDPVSSTTRRKNLVRAHCWVVLAVVVDVPWSSRPWAIPVLFRLFRSKADAGKDYLTKPQFARAMLEVVLAWVPPALRVRVLLDSGYMTRHVLCGLDLVRVTVFGALRTNAALYRAPSPRARGTRGRRRKQGTRLATPAQMHGDRRWGWATLVTDVYQRVRRQRVLDLIAQWYGVLGERATRVAVVDQDAQKVRAFLCTDATVTAAAVLEQIARRWPIEAWNRGIKQDFGFADSPAWSEKAVLRTAPWAALLSGILVVWFHRVWDHVEVPLPERPWYTWKENVSFLDVVRTARAVVRPRDVLTWARTTSGYTPRALAAPADGEKTQELAENEVNKTRAAA